MVDTPTYRYVTYILYVTESSGSALWLKSNSVPKRDYTTVVDVTVLQYSTVQ